jgi:hypothetical protein
MIILQYIITGVLGLTLLGLLLIALYLIWFMAIPEFYKHIKETWLKK